VARWRAANTWQDRGPREIEAVQALVCLHPPKESSPHGISVKSLKAWRKP